MRWCILNLAATFLLGGTTLWAQQQGQGGFPVPNGPRDQNGVLQNPPVRLQPNQQGPQARVPFRDQPIDPTPRAPFDRRQAAGNNQQPQQVAGDQQQPAAVEDQLLGGVFYDNGGGGWGIGPATAEQARGMAAADMMRSAGEFHRDTAAAEVLREKAREHAIDNRYDGVKTYFDVRRLNRRETLIERGPSTLQDAAYRYSKARLPQRLPLTALDRNTGAIAWPAALMTPEFAEHRARLEQVFQGRSYYNSGLASPSYLEIQEEAANMLATLQQRVREMDPSSYVQARNFITGLGYEGRFLAGNTDLALRG